MNKSEFGAWVSDRLGASPSPFDPRNLKYMKLPTLDAAKVTPDEFDGLDAFSPTNFGRDQGNIGSCVGWDWSYCYETELTLLVKHTRAEGIAASPSMKYDYALEDMSAGWAYQQSRNFSVPPVPHNIQGSTNFGAVRAAKRLGIVREVTVPTDTVAPFDTFLETEDMDREAAGHRISSYHYISNDPESIKAAIYGLLHELPYKMPDGSQGKAPVMSAFPVYANFRDAYKDGIVPMPKGRLLGGHSSPIFGWRRIDDGDYWTNFGSWGTGVGDDGKFYIPFGYPFYRNDWWLMKIASTPVPPGPQPSDCPIAKVFTGIYNTGNYLAGGKTRLEAIVPAYQLEGK